MRVYLAAQVFSHTVAAAMQTYQSLGILSFDSLRTIQFIEKMDNLFDIFNSSKTPNSKDFRRPFKSKSNQRECLLMMVSFIETLRVITKNNDADVTNRMNFINGWLISINGLLLLWSNMNPTNDCNFVLYTSRLNTDRLENLFGMFRLQNGNNLNPTPVQLYCAFKKLFCLNYFKHSPNANCLKDLDSILRHLNVVETGNCNTSNIKYLGLTLDSKLRWAPHLQHLIKFTSLWANFLRSISNTWCGSHPSTLLIIYKAVRRSKLDYRCFLSGSASYSHWEKINNLQNSCLKSIIGALKSTPNAAVEIETYVPPFNIRNGWLAGKFLLKNFSFRYPTIFNSFLDIYFSWRYVKKSLPILASTAYSLTSIRDFVINSKKLPLYEINYMALSYSPIVHTNRHFLNCTSKSLKSISPIIVNNLFLDYIQNNFPNSILIYTDGSVSSLSAGYAFFILDLHISMSNNLPSSASSFTTECFAILEALSTISALPPSSYLIVIDSLSCLLSLSSDFFNSRPSPISIRIRQLLYELTLSDFIVEFLWVPGHFGIKGNEIADSIAKSTSHSAVLLQV
ncbi:hypothetical protein QTP88_023385 [Uroleucon formosanum]